MEKQKSQAEVDAEELRVEEAALAEWLNPDMRRLEGLERGVGDQAVRRLVVNDVPETGYHWEED